MIGIIRGIVLLAMLYLYKVKKADIQIVILKGLILGIINYSEQLDDTKRYYFDFYLVFFVISFIYDE